MKELNKLIQSQFKTMCNSGKLFRVNIPGQKLWELYLSSFEKDEIFRDPNSSSHNCNTCSNFVRRYGNVVAIIDNKITSIWDVEIEGEYKPVVKALSETIKSSVVKDVFFETFEELNLLPYEKTNKKMSVFQLGVDKNFKQYTVEEVAKFGMVNTTDVYTFNHLHLFIPSQFVDMTGKSVESIMADYRSNKEVFQRAMETISVDTLLLVKELIEQKSLLDGTTHLHKIEAMIPLKMEYDGCLTHLRDNWCWIKSYKFQFAKFRNELIGVLCSEISDGLDLNLACQNWNKRVDPANYMKAVAPISKKQIEDAKKFVVENNYEDSFNRRFATIEDISIGEILHVNNTTKQASIFDTVKSSKDNSKQSFDNLPVVSIDSFMKDILPTSSSVEVYFSNKHESNLVALTTAENKESKPIFKWSNNYSWTYNGNLAGVSQIKEEVKSKGGKVDGALRFSMMWADGNDDNSDLDLHCLTPNRNEIYFSNKVDRFTGGNLDIDIIQPGGKLAVENITFPSLSKMTDGVYKLWVHQFTSRNSKGFKAEIEFNGELYSYSYDKPVSNNVHVAEVTLKNGVFTIEHKLPVVSNYTSKEVWGINTNEFHQVSLACLSPNYWGDNNTGNKHYLFMIDGCKSDVDLRSFHNENLISELATHRKVLEILGQQTMLKPALKQLAGLGFNATVTDELIVKVNKKQTIKIQF